RWRVRGAYIPEEEVRPPSGDRTAPHRKAMPPPARERNPDQENQAENAAPENAFWYRPTPTPPRRGSPHAAQGRPSSRLRGSQAPGRPKEAGQVLWPARHEPAPPVPSK